MSADLIDRARTAQHSILPQPELIKDLADEIERLSGQIDELISQRDGLNGDVWRMGGELQRIVDYCTDAQDDPAVHAVALLRIHEAASAALSSTDKNRSEP